MPDSQSKFLLHKSDILTHIRSQELDRDNAELIAKRVFVKAHREYKNTIGDNYFYDWLKGIADSEIIGYQLESIDQKLKIHARSLVFDPVESDELLQQTKLKILNNIDNFDGSNLLAYAKTIMKNTRTDLLRRTTTSSEVVEKYIDSSGEVQTRKDTLYQKREEPMSEDTPAIFEEDQIKRTERDQLIECFKKLTPNDRKAELLRLKGFSNQEISTKLKTKVGNIKVRHFRAIKSLQECMGA